LSKKRKTTLNFYARKGGAFDALHSKGLFYPWLIAMFLILEIIRIIIIYFGFSMDIYFLDYWNSRFLFGLDIPGTIQFICLLIAVYIFIHLGIFLTEKHKSRRQLYIGIAFHIFGIVIAILYVLAWGMYGPFIESELDRMVR